MLKTVRDPTLPSVPMEKELTEPSRLVRWIKSLLQVILEQHQNVYDDLRLTQLDKLPSYANNVAAKAGGLQAGDFYRTGGTTDYICVVH
jgi:hypothetical protein